MPTPPAARETVPMPRPPRTRAPHRSAARPPRASRAPCADARDAAGDAAPPVRSVPAANCLRHVPSTRSNRPRFAYGSLASRPPPPRRGQQVPASNRRNTDFPVALRPRDCTRSWFPADLAEQPLAQDPATHPVPELERRGSRCRRVRVNCKSDSVPRIASLVPPAPNIPASAAVPVTPGIVHQGLQEEKIPKPRQPAMPRPDPVPTPSTDTPPPNPTGTGSHRSAAAGLESNSSATPPAVARRRGRRTTSHRRGLPGVPTAPVNIRYAPRGPSSMTVRTEDPAISPLHWPALCRRPPSRGRTTDPSSALWSVAHPDKGPGFLLRLLDSTPARRRGPVENGAPARRGCVAFKSIRQRARLFIMSGSDGAEPFHWRLSSPHPGSRVPQDVSNKGPGFLSGPQSPESPLPVPALPYRAPPVGPPPPAVHGFRKESGGWAFAPPAAGSAVRCRRSSSRNARYEPVAIRSSFPEPPRRRWPPSPGVSSPSR